MSTLIVCNRYERPNVMSSLKLQGTEGSGVRDFLDKQARFGFQGHGWLKGIKLRVSGSRW